MRKRGCQRLQKVLHWEIITLMALPQKLALPTEDSSFSHFFGPERVCVTDLIVSTLSYSRRPRSPSGNNYILRARRALVSPFHQIIMLTVGFILTLSRISMKGCLSNCKPGSVYWGHIDVSGRRPLAAHPALLGWGRINAWILSSLPMGSTFPQCIRLHASLHDQGQGRSNLVGGRGLLAPCVY